MPASVHDIGLTQGGLRQLGTSEDLELAKTVASREIFLISDDLKQPTTCLFVCFFTAYELRMVFAYLDGRKKIKKRIFFHAIKHIHEIQISLSVNKVVWKYNHLFIASTL